MANDQSRPEETQADASTGQGGTAKRPAAESKSVPGVAVAINAPDAAAKLGEPPPVNSLTPEEQMALFEKELKEKDWGHQPC